MKLHLVIGAANITQLNLATLLSVHSQLVAKAFSRQVLAGAPILRDRYVDDEVLSKFILAFQEPTLRLMAESDPMKANGLRIWLISVSLCLGTPAWARDGLAQEAGQSLRSGLEALSYKQGFTISGLEKLKDGSVISNSGSNLSKQLESLLSGYNYLLVYDVSGAISELRILGPQLSAEELEQRQSVKTVRQGNRHMVDAILVGSKGVSRTLPLLVDTGASVVILASSMIEELGFDSTELQDGESVTAAGPIKVKLGQLYSVQVGHAQVRNVAVGFIEDGKIGEQQLLGMSFLSRFKLTIDDEGNRIVLSPR